MSRESLVVEPPVVAADVKPNIAAMAGQKMETDDEPEIIKEILSEPTKEKLSETKKVAGTALYKEKKYREAIPLYTDAIALCTENATLYNNRAACYVMLGKYQEALADCKDALIRDPTNTRAMMRQYKCYFLLGDPTAALRFLAQVRVIDPNHSDLAKETKSAESLLNFIAEGDKAYANGDYRKCVYCMNRALGLAPDCSKFKLLRGECQAYLHKLTEARDISLDILRLEPSNSEAYFVRGLVLYYEELYDKAVQFFQKALRLAPDHQKATKAHKRCKFFRAQKDKGNELYLKGSYQEAYDTYTEGIEYDPLHKLGISKLHCNRAQCLMKLSRHNEALADFDAAIEMDSNYLKAYQRRATCYQQLDMHESAVRDFEHVYQNEKNHANKEQLDQAKVLLKRSKMKDHYKTLGINRQASPDEIKKAYKKLAVKHHPDKHAHATDEEKRKNETLFKELSEAYNVLSDPNKKARYDNGHDLDDMMDGGHSYEDMFPNHFFMNRGGGGQFSGGGNPFQGGSPFGFHFG